MSTENPLVSIIVPVYKVERYLQECVDSLLRQTHSRLEIILVDDGSPDGCGEICDAYAEQDARVRVYHQENGGIAQARNVGLSLANGEYIMFVDSDDWIETDICERAVAAAEEEQVDLVFWSYVREYPGKSAPRQVWDGGDTVFDREDCRKLRRRIAGPTGEELAHPESLDSFSTVWGKMYRRECIQACGATFVDLATIGTSEDTLFNLDVFSGIHKAVYLDSYGYHYRKYNETSCTSSYKSALWQQWQRLYNLLQNSIQNEEASFEKALNNRIALNLIGLGLNLSSSGLRGRDQCKELRVILYSERYSSAVKALDLRAMPLHWKVFFLCGKMRCSVGVLLLCKAIEKLRSYS